MGRPDPIFQREELDQTADTRDHHRTLDKIGRLRRRQPTGTCNDQNRSDICHKHRQYMLQSKRNGFADRHLTIQFVNIINAFIVIHRILLQKIYRNVISPVLLSIASTIAKDSS